MGTGTDAGSPGCDLDTVRGFCIALLASPDLDAKLRRPRQRDGRRLDDGCPGPPLVIEAPARAPGLAMGRGVERAPAMERLREPEARVVHLRRFAHHELMAAELFAWALLTWPAMPSGLRAELLRILGEEQEHLERYLERLDAHGATFAGGPFSDSFWRHARAMRESARGPLAFLAGMGLTLEQANLDFTLQYARAFRAAGDAESARVLERVHADEVGHVRGALDWLRRLKRADEGDLAAYRAAVTPALGLSRAKGRRFEPGARRLAGLDEEWIAAVRDAGPERR